jgi:hypothetical protein
MSPHSEKNRTLAGNRGSTTSVIGRKRPFISHSFQEFERPLSGKADVQILIFEKSSGNDRFARDSGHSAGTMVRGR